MVASLVVTLPSASSGGAVIVHHHGEKKVFRGAKRGSKDLSLLAFYADCHHEVQPVVSGFRVVLTYHLLHHPATSPRTAIVASASVDDLATSVRAYLTTPVAHGYRNPAPERPDRLIYLLDHEYTEKSLAWTHLKNGDRLRVSALRQVAERLDCESYLALADVHENWTCEESDWGGGYRWRGRRHDRGDLEGDESSEHALGELCDSSVELRHWVGHDGRAAPSVPVTPAEHEICFTKASVELDPFKSEHEGYMGNYGNTVDRWYHRAAFVMWPRDRNFVIRAKVSPSWAVSELAARIKASVLPEARNGARSLLPFWARYAPREESPTFFSKLLRVALSLEDAELAHGLLAPFGPYRLNAGALATFAALVERHGLAWSQRLFGVWSEGGVHRHAMPSWLPLLPDLFEALLSSAPRHGRAVGAWLLTREVSAFEQARLASRRLPSIWLGSDDTGEHSKTLLALVKGAAIIKAAATRKHLMALLTTGQTALPILDACALLETCRDGRTPAAVRALGLEELYRRVVEALERTLTAPARESDDWSIELPLRCKCELCTELAAFLRDRNRVEHAWPLAEARRRHIHDMIGAHRLPVTHVTSRRGSPYSLVLTKQNAIFEREATLRERQEASLRWLKKHRSAFVDRRSGE
jgi:hypothetical protein